MEQTEQTETGWTKALLGGATGIYWVRQNGFSDPVLFEFDQHGRLAIRH